MDARNDLIRSCYPLIKAGRLSYANLGTVLGITRQSVFARAKRMGLLRLAPKTSWEAEGNLALRALAIPACANVDAILHHLRVGFIPSKGYYPSTPEQPKAPPKETPEPPKPPEDPWTHDQKWEWVRDDAGAITHILTALPTRALKVPLSAHREMRADYSNWDGQGSALTINQMAAKWGLTRAEYLQYKIIHGWTKSDEPFIALDLDQKSVEELTDNVIQRRRRALLRSVEQEQLRLDRDDAKKFRQIEAGLFHPFKQLATHLELHEPPPLEFLHRAAFSARKLIVNACDWQIGEISQRDELVRGGADYSVDAAVAAVARYIQRIADYVDKSTVEYDEVILCDLGDLGHGLEGFTAHGTPLEVGAYRQKQVDVIFNCLQALISSLRQIAPVSAYHVEGNHLGFGSTLIWRELASWYGGEHPSERVKIHLNSKPVTHVRVSDDILLVLFHGKSGRQGAKGIARTEVRRERDAYWLTQEAVRENPTCSNVYLLTGHMHSRIVEEFPDVTVMQFGTAVQADSYADAIMVSGGRPTQSIIEADTDTGLMYHVPIPLD